MDSHINFLKGSVRSIVMYLRQLPATFLSGSFPDDNFFYFIQKTGLNIYF